MDVVFQGRQKRETMGLKTTDTTDVFLSKSEGIILVSVNIFNFNQNQNVNNYFHVNIFLIHHLIIGQRGATHTHFDTSQKCLCLVLKATFLSSLILFL